jgi:hypothetical protein
MKNTSSSIFGYLVRASNISFGPIGTQRAIPTDDQPAEVTTPDGIIRAAFQP